MIVGIFLLYDSQRSVYSLSVEKKKAFVFMFMHETLETVETI